MFFFLSSGDDDTSLVADEIILIGLEVLAQINNLSLISFQNRGSIYYSRDQTLELIRHVIRLWQ